MLQSMGLLRVGHDLGPEKQQQIFLLDFPGGSVVKNLPAKQETWFLSLVWEDFLEKEMATHSSILAWEIPWAEEPAGVQPTGSQESEMTKPPPTLS